MKITIECEVNELKELLKEDKNISISPEFNGILEGQDAVDFLKRKLEENKSRGF